MKKLFFFIVFLLCSSVSFAQIDNVDITFYNTENSNIVSNYVNDFDFDNNGNVWITHGNSELGLSMFDGTSFINYIPDINIPTDVTFKDIEIDNNNNIWVLVWQKFEYGCNCYPIGYSRALLFFDGTNWEYYTPSNSQLPTIYYGSIKTDSLGNVWFITNDGLSKFDGTNTIIYNPPISTLPSPENFSENNFMEIDDNDIIWIVKEGLISFNNGSWSLYPYSFPGYFNAVLTIHDNSIYLGQGGYEGSLGDAFFKFNGNTYEGYTEFYETCDLSNDIEAGYKGICFLDFDSQGNLWAGFGSESDVYNEETGEYIYIGIKNLTDCLHHLTGIGLSNTKLKIDNQDNVWVRSNEGLLRLSSENLNIANNNVVNSFIYPNPVRDQLTITNNQDSEYEYSIYDISGKLLQKDTAIYNQPISVSQLQQGTYVVKTISNNENYRNYKFIKR